MAEGTPKEKSRVRHHTRKWAEDALSNYVVLKTIVNNLDTKDIETCCQVSKFWYSVADPLLVRYYDVMLRNTSGCVPPWKRGRYTPISISKHPTYNTKRVKAVTYSLEDADKFIERAAQTEKISINFTMCLCDESDDTIAKFLSTIGPLTENLDMSSDVTTRRLCEMLGRFFPNLKYLDLSSSVFQDPDDLYFEPHLQNKLKYLQRIDNSECTPTPGCLSWANILRMAPNLKEIHGFQILYVDALIETGQGPCVKSLTLTDRLSEPEEQFEAALAKLANLHLQLVFFDFNYVWPEFFFYAQIERFIRAILESSQDSLQTLNLFKTEAFDFQALPPMYALKLVKFSLNNKNTNCSNRFFSSGTVLENVFPNVSSVAILHPLCHYPVSCIVRWFPEDQFSTWKIRKLKLEDANLSNLQVLSRSFPQLCDLKIDTQKRGDSFHHIMPVLSLFWPDIEHVTIRFLFGSDYGLEDDDWTFDSIFTGIPRRDACRLAATDPLDWNTHFPVEQLEKWRERSVLRRFTGLKILKFDLAASGSWRSKFIEKLLGITSVSREFAFQFTPDLKFVIRMYPEVDEHEVSVLRSYLEPLVNFEVQRFEEAPLHFKLNA